MIRGLRIAKVITLTDEERLTLTKWSRGQSTPARLVQRARIILAAANGRENQDIAAELGCTRRTVGTWRTRFVTQRFAGIEHDAPRVAARRRSVAQRKQRSFGRQTLAKVLGVSKDPVQRVWRDNGLQPHRTKTFKVSNDPQFAEKLVEIVSRSAGACAGALV